MTVENIITAKTSSGQFGTTCRLQYYLILITLMGRSKSKEISHFCFNHQKVTLIIYVHILINMHYASNSLNWILINKRLILIYLASISLIDLILCWKKIKGYLAGSMMTISWKNRVFIVWFRPTIKFMLTEVGVEHYKTTEKQSEDKFRRQN